MKVLDFGLAQVMDASPQARITAAGMVHGTPAYMSPEQCRSELPDERSDLYSLGCMLYELVIGQPPFGDAPFAEVSGPSSRFRQRSTRWCSSAWRR